MLLNSREKHFRSWVCYETTNIDKKWKLVPAIIIHPINYLN